ncbi:hypothetical protein M404DRAFT_306379 [Pisolithus tinctorius Marx 270]|uniref:Uncharacterized protein n=1 Tax=Pisolithus tinctorius Marx 270 TaxID=870435 RepID=A0A0C3JJ07_PISTI|nr:hypothetical protein M404DRAFT_306379 [Pisolithus tinctorius Marx 270]
MGSALPASSVNHLDYHSPHLLGIVPLHKWPTIRALPTSRASHRISCVAHYPVSRIIFFPNGAPYGYDVQLFSTIDRFKRATTPMHVHAIHTCPGLYTDTSVTDKTVLDRSRRRISITSRISRIAIN